MPPIPKAWMQNWIKEIEIEFIAVGSSAFGNSIKTCKVTAALKALLNVL